MRGGIFLKVNIEAERVRKQITKQELCTKLGITTKTYLNYLRGVTAIPSTVLVEMAELFQCSTDYLLGR